MIDFIQSETQFFILCLTTLFTLINPIGIAPLLMVMTERFSKDEKVEIVKNNAAQVYWPEYSFNGIGDILPGQGYQLKAREDFTIKWPATTYPPASNGEFSYFND